MNGRVNTYSITLWLIGIVLTVTTNAQEAVSFSNTIGEVSYESKDHRSNVYEAVSDRKVVSSNQYQGVILAATDYCPYGSEMGGRSFRGDYKYGFQGQEKDDEVKGRSNSINYKFRIHDPRVGRFFGIDPLAINYPYNSTYAFSENTLINAVELEGLEKSPSFILPKAVSTYIAPISVSNEIRVYVETENKFFNTISGFLTWLDNSILPNGGGGYHFTSKNTNNSSNAAARSDGEPDRQWDITEAIEFFNAYSPGSLKMPKGGLKNSKELHEFVTEVEDKTMKIIEEAGYETEGYEDLMKDLKNHSSAIEEQYKRDNSVIENTISFVFEGTQYKKYVYKSGNVSYEISRRGKDINGKPDWTMYDSSGLCPDAAAGCRDEIEKTFNEAQEEYNNQNEESSEN